jgi:F-type H+-transporting ATPase subunit delta
MISEIYEMLMNQHNDQANITIATTEAISDGDIKAISALLEKKYNKSINIENFVDNEIIGGARVMTNQSVIDGSLKNKLNKLTLWLRK